MADNTTEDCIMIEDDADDRDNRNVRNDRGRFEERGKFDSRGENKAFGVEDLASKILQIQAKKFYLDVKQNKRGKFIKISEVGATGHRNRIIFDMSTASDFHEMLTNFIEEYSTLGPRGSSPHGDNKIKSDVIYSGERRYYMDLKENSRGRFLKLIEERWKQDDNSCKLGGDNYLHAVASGKETILVQVAMTLPPPSMERQQIVIPAQGMIDIRDALTEFLSEFGSSEKNDETTNNSESKLSLDSENKVFHFDIGENKRGDYLRISEVSPSFRTAINIPQQIWSQFVNQLRSMNSRVLPNSDFEQNLDATGAGDAIISEQCMKEDFVF